MRHIVQKQRCKQPTRCKKYRLLNFLNQLYMFRATNSPILRSNLTVYTAFGTMHRFAVDWWQVWDGTDVPSQTCPRSTAISVHCTKSCIYSQKVLMRMGEFVARNM